MFTSRFLGINIVGYGTERKVISNYSCERRIHNVDTKVSHSPAHRQSTSLTTIFQKKVKQSLCRPMTGP
jgi:hypothetical protein